MLSCVIEILGNYIERRAATLKRLGNWNGWFDFSPRPTQRHMCHWRLPMKQRRTAQALSLSWKKASACFLRTNCCEGFLSRGIEAELRPGSAHESESSRSWMYRRTTAYGSVRQ